MSKSKFAETLNLNQMRKISLLIAMSLDGYISKPNDDLSFLKLVEKEGEDYGYSEFISTIDTIIIGRKTGQVFFLGIKQKVFPF